MAAPMRRICGFVRNFGQHLKPISLVVSPQIRRIENRGICSNGGSLFRTFSSTIPRTLKETVNITFSLSDGSKQTAKAKVGDNLLDVIVDNDLDIDGFGACEGTLACSTCHLIFKRSDYDKLAETPTDEELDMLDLAYSLTDTSRLGCQVIVTKDMENWEIKVPQGVADARDV